MFFGRGKNKAQNAYTLKDSYKFYCEQMASNKLYKIDWELYQRLNHAFYKEIMNYIIEKSGQFKMSYRLGTLSVLKEKIDLNKLNNKAIDWAATNKYGKVIYHLNEHTDGYKYSFQWDKQTNLPNLFFYRLVQTRNNKRRLAKLIKSGDYDYFER